jgi:hypothetical protein
LNYPYGKWSDIMLVGHFPTIFNYMKLKLNKFTCKLIFFYCVQKFGKHEKKPVPKIVFSKSNKEIFGDYCWDKNKIRIFYKRHLNEDVKNPVFELVDTICHEYKHYLHSSALAKSIKHEHKSKEDLLEDEAIRFAKAESRKFYNKLMKNG